jgi:hypothetical protein
MDNFGIQGLTFAGQGAVEPPILLVIGKEKCGKSTLALSLFDWPNQGDRPLVLAFDALGFDSTAQFAPCPGVKVKDQPGLTFWDKTNNAITNLEQVFRSGRRTPFTSLLVDCGSTMVDKFMQEGRGMGARDPRQAFGYALNKSNEVLWRLIELGKPLIWLAWLKEGFMDVQGSGQAKRTKMVLGGAQIEGSFRAKLTGKATQVIILEKVKQLGAQGADAEGYVRQFHTRTYDNVEAGGRLSQFLPEPCPAHLGYVLSLLTQGRPLATQAPQQLMPQGDGTQPQIGAPQ